ncbi:MAG: hypothetical protein ACM3ZV_05890 [Bacillota bacterium]
MFFALALAWSAAAPAQAATAMTLGGVPVAELRGRGAAVPFAEYEAENGRYDGTLIGPSRRLSDVAAEASGRRAVRLERARQFVEFVLARPANALTVRYSIPDAPRGGGQDSRLAVYAGGERVASLPLTSRYGWFYGTYPFSNRPSDGGAHHFFDEARQLLPRTLPAGTLVRLQAESANTVVDLADFEQVAPPLAPPAGAIDIGRLGADPTGVRESSRALRRAIRDGQRTGRPVWIGPGTFRIDTHVTVDRVTIAGAGPWHSILFGRGAGLYGRSSPHGSTHVHLSGFAILGDVRDRVDRADLAGIGGSMSRSTVRNLWLQHHKTGIWLEGPASGLVIEDVRIVDNSADGINLAGGVTDARLTNLFVRNSGDDGIALWSRGAADRRITVAHNSVIAPVLANGIAVYGGADIAVSANLVADSLTEGGGIHVGNRFRAVLLSGRMEISGNLLVRDGSYDPHWRFGVGALWFYALDQAIDADVEVTDNELDDSTIAAVQFLGKPIRNVRFRSLSIDGANHWLQVQSGGEASFAEVRARGLRLGDYVRCDGDFRASFTAIDPALTRPTDRLCGALDPAIVERSLSR